MGCACAAVRVSMKAHEESQWAATGMALCTGRPENPETGSGESVPLRSIEGLIDGHDGINMGSFKPSELLARWDGRCAPVCG